MNNATIGSELIGSRFEYDNEGNIISHWEISPDSVEAKYFVEYNFQTKPFKNKEYKINARNVFLKKEIVFKNKEIDSVIDYDSAGRITSVSNYIGKGCYNLLKPNPYGTILFFNNLSLQGSPYYFDTLTIVDYNSESGKILRKKTETPDSIVEDDYGFKSGK